MMSEKIIAAVQIRSSVATSEVIKRTLKMLGLRHVNNMAVLPVNPTTLGMIKKVGGFIAWGELSQELHSELETKHGKKTVYRLKPPKQGLKSVKLPQPQGDLGYHGEKINALVKRMI
ncbi:MAG: uL30 family ribosomal protein [Candidatus Aenigmatarchaeota archaeon]